MTIYAPTPDYEATVGATAKRLRGNPGAMRGVPSKAAKALLTLASMERQPRRLAATQVAGHRPIRCETLLPRFARPDGRIRQALQRVPLVW
jgi:hypothetical protein